MLVFFAVQFGEKLAKGGELVKNEFTTLDKFDFSWLDNEYDEMTDFSPQIDVFPYFEADFGLGSQKKHRRKSRACFAIGVLFMPLLCCGMNCINEAAFENSIAGIYRIVTAALVAHGSLPNKHMQKSEADQIILDFYTWFEKQYEDTELSKREFMDQIVRAYYLRALTTEERYTGAPSLSKDDYSRSTAYDIICDQIFSGNKSVSFKGRFEKLKNLRVRLQKLNFADSYIYSVLDLKSFIAKSEREKTVRDATNLREKKNKADS